jgi:hypothetical protein
MVKLGEIKAPNRTIFTQDFSSIHEFYEHCKTAPINKKVFSKLASVKGEYSFTLTRSYEEAEKLLLNGWDEGSKKLTQKLKMVNSQVAAKEIKRAVYDIVGFQASVPRYLQGIPTNMINKKTVKQKQKVITITKGMNYNASVSAERIMEDSIKFIQIVQAVEATGVRVNINLLSYSFMDNEGICVRMPIKKSSERFNISKMSFPLLHPGFFRRMIFRAKETEMRVKNNWGFGYGRSAMGNDYNPVVRKDEYFIPPLISEQAALSIVNNIKNAK